MNIIYVMIPLGLVLLGAAIAFFFWAVRNGQFDDLEIQGSLVLFDDEPPTRVPTRPATVAAKVVEPASVGGAKR